MKKKLLTLNHKYSVHSGVFAGVDTDIYMSLDKYGNYQYRVDKKLNRNTNIKLNEVDTMSDYSENEDSLSQKIFGSVKDIKHDNLLGYYSDLFIGHVKESDFRKIGSSGGFGTWLLVELLNNGEVDGVIHPHPVDPGKNDGVLFKYHISRSEKDIKKGAKTRYYPLELSEVLKEVKRVPGKYAVVGISEFITELRLLCEQDNVFKQRVCYMIGLFNAHQKTTKYAEALAWQQGIKPGDLRAIDFRVKAEGGMAWDYRYRFEGYKNGKVVSITSDANNTPLSHWNMGYFKKYFSDFTDNAFNELADITLGDAWLHEYAKDYRGTNILIVRNPVIAKILELAIESGRVELKRVTAQEIISSQGMVSHIVDELPYRLYMQGKYSEFVPKKRTSPTKKLPLMRRRVQGLRRMVAEDSNKVYAKAVNTGDMAIFMDYVAKQEDINNRIYSVIKKIENFKTQRHKLISRTKKAKEIVGLNTVRLRQRTKKAISISKNRKIDGAILSLCDDYNYGNVMQRYALQKILSRNNLRFTQLSLFTNYLQSVRERYPENGLMTFVVKNIQSDDFSPVESVGYRTYIVGSDQVWRNHGTDDLDHDYMPYWLGFLGRVRSNIFSYAASFGVDNLKEANIDRELVNRIRPFMEKFSAISVREESGKKLVDIIAGSSLRVKTVIDPTMLLTKEDYSNLVDGSFDSKASIKTNGVFGYILDLNADKERILKSVAETEKLDVSVVNPDPSRPLPSVEEWLKGFRDSRFVVTDSFHGTIFSIINGVDFIVIANHGRGLTRIENLLSKVGISSDRIIIPSKAKGFNHEKVSKIDWESVNNKLTSLRADSEQWLLDQVKHAK